MTGRYAIYFAPEPGTALWQFGTSWLGRDPETGERQVERLGLPERLHAKFIAAPARYGFHGTLKPPFWLARQVSSEELQIALGDFAAARHPFVTSQLRFDQLRGFLALVPFDEGNALSELAADCVTLFDKFRAPSTEAEIARRNSGTLTTAQQDNLYRWGYPYVLETFRFHMTLTGKLTPEEMATVRPLLQRATDVFLEAPLSVSSVSLYHEPAPSEPFQLIGRFHLGSPKNGV